MQTSGPIAADCSSALDARLITFLCSLPWSLFSAVQHSSMLSTVLERERCSGQSGLPHALQEASAVQQHPVEPHEQIVMGPT